MRQRDGAHKLIRSNKDHTLAPIVIAADLQTSKKDYIENNNMSERGNMRRQVIEFDKKFADDMLNPPSLH